MRTAIIALGSNRPHVRHGAPANVLRAAVAGMAALGIIPKRLSPIHRTAAIGPGGRAFANAVLVAETDLEPLALLTTLKSIERAFGRRGGRRWGARVLDLDILALGDTAWPSRLRWQAGRDLAIPHHALHRRTFVLDPLVEVAPNWRHPRLDLTARQLRARLTSRTPISISRREGP